MTKTKGVPSQQPFNITGRPNQSKKNSWWNKNSSSYFARKKKA